VGILGVGFLGGCTQKKPPGFLGTYPVSEPWCNVCTINLSTATTGGLIA